MYTNPYYLNVKWRPFWKMAAMAFPGIFHEGSISNFVYNGLVYTCAKFGAFRQNWTIVLLCRLTIKKVNLIKIVSHYLSLKNEWFTEFVLFHFPVSRICSLQINATRMRKNCDEIKCGADWSKIHILDISAIPFDGPRNNFCVVSYFEQSTIDWALTSSS